MDRFSGFGEHWDHLTKLTVRDSFSLWQAHPKCPCRALRSSRAWMAFRNSRFIEMIVQLIDCHQLTRGMSTAYQLQKCIEVIKVIYSYLLRFWKYLLSALYAVAMITGCDHGPWWQLVNAGVIFDAIRVTLFDARDHGPWWPLWTRTLLLTPVITSIKSNAHVHRPSSWARIMACVYWALVTHSDSQFISYARVTFKFHRGTLLQNIVIDSNY